MESTATKSNPEVGKLLVLTAMSGKLDSISDILDGVVDINELLDEDTELANSMSNTLSSIEALTELVQARIERAFEALEPKEAEISDNSAESEIEI